MQYNSIAERLKHLRKQLELSQTEFGRKIGKNYHSVMRWELGRVLPPAGVIEHIASTFKVSEQWLENGTGEIFTVRNAESLSDNETVLYNSGSAGRQNGEIVLSAPKGSTPPVTTGDMIFLRKCSRADKDGLYLITDRYGDSFIRWYSSAGGLWMSKRNDYQDIKASDAEVSGEVVKILREIEF